MKFEFDRNVDKEFLFMLTEFKFPIDLYPRVRFSVENNEAIGRSPRVCRKYILLDSVQSFSTELFILQHFY